MNLAGHIPTIATGVMAAARTGLAGGGDGANGASGAMSAFAALLGAVPGGTAVQGVLQVAGAAIGGASGNAANGAAKTPAGGVPVSAGRAISTDLAGRVDFGETGSMLPLDFLQRLIAGTQAGVPAAGLAAGGEVTAAGETAAGDADPALAAKGKDSGATGIPGILSGLIAQNGKAAEVLPTVPAGNKNDASAVVSGTAAVPAADGAEAGVIAQGTATVAADADGIVSTGVAATGAAAASLGAAAGQLAEQAGGARQAQAGVQAGVSLAAKASGPTGDLEIVAAAGAKAGETVEAGETTAASAGAVFGEGDAEGEVAAQALRLATAAKRGGETIATSGTSPQPVAATQQADETAAADEARSSGPATIAAGLAAGTDAELSQPAGNGTPTQAAPLAGAAGDAALPQDLAATTDTRAPAVQTVAATATATGEAELQDAAVRTVSAPTPAPAAAQAAGLQISAAAATADAGVAAGVRASAAARTQADVPAGKTTGETTADTTGDGDAAPASGAKTATVTVTAADAAARAAGAAVAARAAVSSSTPQDSKVPADAKVSVTVETDETNVAAKTEAPAGRPQTGAVQTQAQAPGVDAAVAAVLPRGAASAEARHIAIGEAESLAAADLSASLSTGSDADGETPVPGAKPQAQTTQGTAAADMQRPGVSAAALAFAAAMTDGAGETSTDAPLDGSFDGRIEIGRAEAQAHASTAALRGSTAALPQNVAVASAHLAAEVARFAQKGQTRFQIRMDPPELGRVDVELKVSRDGTVKAHLSVERSETLDMFLRDQRGLERALDAAGLKLDSGGLEMSLKNQNGFAGFDRGEGGHDRFAAGEGGGLQKEDGDTLPMAAARAYVTGASGALDIQI
ncbi:flagellar hook-length control protein FliK [Stappia indica]|uniref:flagellar hook-length control protein FliK n=1 Tax=Stappia indica TaxID=538381 RepID=UPI001D1962CB|nr:flagellar hook-length control protein FliK [Stappia indica]MCC4242813.1 flagellar hook-length control protein FliK [Stappia indica]